ncbi:MAG: glycine cleavage system protein H, partial [Spirochaetota bacterium]|nr:glycine cleavage system protein H [Spirochaetota bacterium]
MNNQLYISETHEWVKIVNNTAIIGITDFAQKELGDIVFLEIIKKNNEKVKS